MFFSKGHLNKRADEQRYWAIANATLALHSAGEDAEHVGLALAELNLVTRVQILFHFFC